MLAGFPGDSQRLLYAESSQLAKAVRKSGTLDFRTDWVHPAPTPARRMT